MSAKYRTAAMRMLGLGGAPRASGRSRATPGHGSARGSAPLACRAAGAVGAALLIAVYATSAQGAARLFPVGLPELQWTEFDAGGFSPAVAGLIFRTANPACCGVAVGGLGTGALDLNTDGVLGYNSIFVGDPRRAPLLLPFLGLAVGQKTWVLATQKYLDGGPMDACTPIIAAFHDTPPETVQVAVPKVEGVEAATEIDYWGHYPVADLEYQTTAPVSVGLRAWAPLVLGDVAASNIPGAVFEVYLRNTTDKVQQGAIAFSFPGPTRRNLVALPWFQKYIPATDLGDESRSTDFTRREVTGDFQGIAVTSLAGVGYALGVIGPEEVRLGGGLSSGPDAWSKIASELPSPRGGEAGGVMIYNDPSASAAVDFQLGPGEDRVVRFVLAWYSPRWQGGPVAFVQQFEDLMTTKGPGPYPIPGRDPEPLNYFYQMYATRYRNAADVAGHLAREHEGLLQRVLAWQEAIYADRQLPGWLRDCLVNNLNLIAEDSYWAQARPPLGDWAFPMGAFNLEESPRGCPCMGCIASNWYGDFPILYFYPELERQILRNYTAYLREDGAIPFLFSWADFVNPTYEWQKGINAVCYVDLVDRLWRRTGDDSVVREFYPAVKKNIVFTLGLFHGPDFVIRMPEGNKGAEWWERDWWAGMVTHMGALRLSMLQSAERMARKVGDAEFADQCRGWFELGSRSLNEKMWSEKRGSYLLYNEPETGKMSEEIMSNQLDGDFASFIKGLPPVFPRDRALTVLDTVKRTCVVDVGAVGVATPEGQPQLEAYGTFPPEIVMLGITYMHYGQMETGLDVIYRNMNNLVVKQRYAWDLPNLIRCDTGARTFGNDYYQNMMLWAVPSAIEGTDLAGSCRPGGLVDRVLKAANPGR